MKQNELEVMVDLLKRQLGYDPSFQEIENMKELASVQVDGAKKVKASLKSLNALEEVYENEHCSWYDGQYIRNKDCLDKPGIYYRGNILTKGEMFERSRKIAAALYANGITKGKSFAFCASNVPDLITTLLATSYVGAKITIFDSSFDPEYIKKIINSCDADFVFTTDINYGKIKNILPNTKSKRTVLLSLADHLPEKFPKDYEELNIPRELYDFPNLAKEYQKQDENIILIDQFIQEGSHLVPEEIKDQNPSIYDEFTVTFSSGSSRPGWPKAIPHRVIGYLTMMRFHDQDMSGLPDLSNIVGLAHIPPLSDTNLKSIISDTLGQKSIVACEPVYGAKTLIYSILMNKPNFCDATRSSWIQFAKDILFDPKFKGLKLPYLALPLAVGEQLETNERDFIDKAFSVTKAGKQTLKEMGYPFPHTFLGEGGGRTESGGIVYSVFQSFFEKINKLRLKKERYGMGLCAFVDVAIINEHGKECQINEIGELCAKSTCTMSDGKYFFEEDNDTDFNLIDNYGRVWPRFKVYAYRNEIGNIIMKGRMGSEFTAENQKIPEFIIADMILKDKKNILSCEVINYNNIPVINIQLNPLVLQEKKYDKIVKEVLLKIEKNSLYTLPRELTENMVYRFIPVEQAFPLTGCQKRDTNGVYQMGLTNCIKPVLVNEDMCLMNAETYLENKEKFNHPTLIKKNSLTNIVHHAKTKIKTRKNDKKQ